MPDESKIVIYDTETGELKNIISDTETNREIALGNNENIAIIPKGRYLSSTPDENKSLYKSTEPRNESFDTDKTNNIKIAGPISYDIPQRLFSTHAALGKLIFGGQYLTIGDEGINGRIIGSGDELEFWAGQSWISNLKLELGDNFQILGSNNTRIDGIYKFTGSSSYSSIFATKLVGASAGDSGFVGVSGGSINPNLRAIRLQEVDGSVYGVSSDHDGCGIYKYGESVEQSVYEVNNSDDVIHSTSEFVFGNSSAYFDGGNGTVGPLLSVNNNRGFTFDSSSKYYFKLDGWIKFEGNPTADAILFGKAGKTTTSGGVFRLRYETTPPSFVFDYSTNDAGTDYNNTLSTGSLGFLNVKNWNHVQVEFGDVEGRIYVNGTLKALSSLGSTEEIFTEDSSPFVIGADDDGTSPFKGYMDQIHLRFAKATEAGSTLMLAKNIYDIAGTTSAGATLAVGTTFALPTFGSTGEQNTKLLFNMDGVNNCTIFTEDGLNVTESKVETYDEDRRVMYISDFGITGSNTGYAVSGAYVHGYNQGLTVGATAGITGNSHAIRPLVGIEIGLTAQGVTLTGHINSLVSAEELSLIRNVIGVPMAGTSLASGDFPSLFALGGASFGTGGTGPNGSTTGSQDSLSLYATTSNLGRIQELNELVGACSGVSGDIFYLVNSDGGNFGIYGKEISSLLTDVLVYRNTKRTTQESNVSEIKSATSFQALSTSGKTKATTNSLQGYNLQAKGSGTVYSFGSGP